MKHYHAEVITSWQAMEPRWLRLQAKGFGTPFQSAHWLKTWYGVFGEQSGVEPVLVAVSDQSGGDDVLLLPLTRRNVGSLRMIEFADQWASDYNAPLIGPNAPTAPTEAEALWRAVLAVLPSADRIRFTKMPVEVGGRKNPLALLHGAKPSETHGYIVELPERWEDYQRSLKKDVQSLLRRRWNRLVKETQAQLRWIEDPDEGRRIVAVLQQQQTARLDSLGARHVFDQPAYAQFYERHVVDGLATGSAVLTAITAGDDVIATFLAVADGRCCTLVRSSQQWGQTWMPFGLGKLIIERSMQALHERGYRRFDLSIGDFAYKHDFGVLPVPMVDLDVARSWRALPALCRDYTWAQLKKNPRAANLARSARRLLSYKSGPAPQTP